MASNILPNLIKYIVSEVQDDGYVVFRTRLVKLLYLSDVYYYQSYRKTITELNWIRYKYGPFSFELLPITRRIGLDLGEEELDFSIGHGVKYEVYDLTNTQKWLNPRQKLYIDRVIRRWGGEDLNELLDYVYCETEPMKQSKFNQPLNFSSIRSGLRYAETDDLELSTDSIKQIKNLLDKQEPISKPPTIVTLINKKKDIITDEKSATKLSGKVRIDDIASIDFSGGRE